MTAPLRCVTAASGAAWEADLVTRCAAGSSGVEVVARCVDPGELRARLAADRPDAVVLDAGPDWLDATLVDTARSSGAVVVAVADAADARPARLGCDHVVDPGSGGVAAALARIAAGEHPGEGPRRVGPGVGAAGRHRGTVVGIWGPKGGTGRTTVAVNLAWELALDGARVVLLDADTTGGTVALALGLAELPSIAGLAEAAGHGILDDGFLDPYPEPLRGLRVVPGIARPSAWPEVRDADLLRLLDVLRTRAHVVVVDVAACLEDDDELLAQAWPWRRNQAARAVLGAADVVAATVWCDPASARHAVLAAAELAALVDRARVLTVVNGAPSASAGREVAGELVRRCGWRPGVVMPHDRTAATAAWRGRALAEVRPRSPLRRRIEALAATVGARGAGDRSGSRVPDVQR